jgi:hypothetical protein
MVKRKYGDPKLAPVKSTRGKIHDYLAIKLDFSNKGMLKRDICDYIKCMASELPEELDKV